MDTRSIYPPQTATMHVRSPIATHAKKKKLYALKIGLVPKSQPSKALSPDKKLFSFSTRENSVIRFLLLLAELQAA